MILPAKKDTCRDRFGEDEVKKISKCFSFSYHHNKIDEIADDIEAQLLERINASPWYAIHVDNSTDVDNKAILLVISSKMMCMRIYHVHYFCQLTTQLQNYLVLERLHIRRT